MLWRSAPGELPTSGKYNEAAFGGGLVFVGTDRVQAFGAGGTREENRHAFEAADAQPQMAANASDVAGLDAKAIYGQRCAMCHDHPQGNIPSRARLATLPRERIIGALTTGVMRSRHTSPSEPVTVLVPSLITRRRAARSRSTPMFELTVMIVLSTDYTDRFMESV